MLYSPPQYSGITAQSGSGHLMQDDAFGDRLTPAVNNPNGVTALPTALSCNTGNENQLCLQLLKDEKFYCCWISQLSLCKQLYISLYCCLCVCVCAGFDAHSQAEGVAPHEDVHGGDFFGVVDHSSSQVSCFYNEG